LTELRLDKEDFSQLARQILSEGHALRFRIVGVSMWPLIRDGDLVEIQPAAPDSYRKGDILLYEQQRGVLLVHRVIAVKREDDQMSLLMQGDALRSADGLAALSQVLGRVALVDRNGRLIHLDSPFQRLLGRLLAVFLPLYKQLI
jgi:signal peptidase I